MRVLGIDPGSRRTGFGIVEERGRDLTIVASGAIVPRGSSATRLGHIASEVEALLDLWQPTAVAVERAFVGRNVQSALRLGEVRGAVFSSFGRRGLPVVDYSPATVKVAVAGVGNADKESVARGVSQLAGVEFAAGDEADALAIAICHLRHGAFAARVEASEGRAVRTVRPRGGGKTEATRSDIAKLGGRSVRVRVARR